MNKYHIQALLIGFVLLLLIFFSLANIDPVPYSKDSVFSHVYPYTEGLEGSGPTSMNTDPPPSMNNNPMTTPPSINMESMTSPMDKNKSRLVEGFEGLQSSAYGQEKPIDIFSQLKYDKNCKPSSSLSNSLGYLCLDDNAKQLLLTRGGNQSGNASEIG